MSGEAKKKFVYTEAILSFFEHVIGGLAKHSREYIGILSVMFWWYNTGVSLFQAFRAFGGSTGQFLRSVQI